MAGYAKTVGVKNFLALYKAFEQSVRRPRGYSIINNATCFDGQPLELDSGGWTADESGVYKSNPFGERVYACSHPVMPVERLVNIDTGEEKLRLAYRKGGGPWRTLIADKRLLASASRVTELAGNGISVTSDNAKQFIRYIFDLESLNYDLLPERRSVGRLGYIQGGGFSPYVPGLLFDGDACFKSLFEAISCRGKFQGEDREDQDCWSYAARWASAQSVTARVILAASFAAPLLEVLGCLPFFVHLWGADSGTGKTVALMLAASVWGDPQIGRYIKTFDSTAVGCEKTAAFLHHLPLCLDELQLARDGRGRSSFDVYRLAEGVGRTRGTKQGGVETTPTWRNTIITTGESPLTTQSAGAGAVNRVIDVECTAGDPPIPQGKGMWLSGLLRRNYGHAGKRFVSRLYESQENQDMARCIYQAYFSELTQGDTTEKQAMAAAALLTADCLAYDWVFGCRRAPMGVEDIRRFLATRASVSLGQRAYDLLCEWVASNKPMFLRGTDLVEQWGELSLQQDMVYIIASRFAHVMEDNGFNERSVLSWLSSNGKLGKVSTDRKRFKVKKKINGIAAWCVCLRLDSGS